MLFRSFKVIGDKKSLSKEAVLAAQPDIIVGRDKLFNAKALGTVAELNAAGIAAVPQKASVTGINPILETVLEDIQTYGKIFNAQDKATELTAQFAARIKETDALVLFYLSLQYQVLSLHHVRWQEDEAYC